MPNPQTNEGARCCPTCGSDDPAIRPSQVALTSGKRGPCPDPFHLTDEGGDGLSGGRARTDRAERPDGSRETRITASPAESVTDEGERGVWSREFTDATNLFYAEIQVDEPEPTPDGPTWPAMVTLEIEPGSVLDYDARRLGQLLIEAADECDWRNRRDR